MFTNSVFFHFFTTIALLIAIFVLSDFLIVISFMRLYVTTIRGQLFI
jgi:hypothetical protein